MTEPVNAHARAFRTWLDAPDPSQEAQIRELPDLSDEPWKAMCRADPHLVSLPVVRILLTLAHQALGRNPTRSLWLARLATRLARDTWGPDIDALIAAEGDAWREYASALFETGYYTDARMAVQEARSIYRLSPTTGRNEALLRIIEGRVLHELGFTAQGLSLIEKSAKTLLHRFDDKKSYVTARIAHAIVLFTMEEYRTAADTLSRAATLAQEQEDSETLAYIVNLVGRCSVRLRDFRRAEECFRAALEMFETAGLYAEMPRVRKGIVEILVAKNRFNEAISELYMARSEFLSMEMPVIAALVSLDIVDLLLVQKRTSEVELLCNEMITTFTRARLPSNAMKALQHLQSLASASTVTDDDVQRVRAYLELLPSDPDQLFRAQ